MLEVLGGGEMTDRILTLEQTDTDPPTIRVVCSICKQAFKPGERYLGQVTATFAHYDPGWHLGHTVDIPAGFSSTMEILDFFHRDCLE